MPQHPREAGQKQKCVYIPCLGFIFAAFQVFHEGNPQFRADPCHCILLCHKSVRDAIAAEKGLSSDSEAILRHCHGLPTTLDLHRAVEMGKGRNSLWKEADVEIPRNTGSVCLQSPSPGEMNACSLQSLILFWFITIWRSVFVSPSTEASPSNRTYKKYTQIEKKR